MVKISKEASKWLNSAKIHDGCELPVTAWSVGEELVDAGLATMGGTCGELVHWKWLKPVAIITYPPYEIETNG